MQWSYLFENPLGSLSPKTWLYVTHSQSWKIHLVKRDVQLELSLAHYLVIAFRLSSYVYILKKVSALLGFHMTLSNCPYFYLSLPKFHLVSFFIPPPFLILLFHPPTPQAFITIYSISPS